MTDDTQLDDPYRLERFVAAQNAGETYKRALTELRGGSKQSHWMWFIFPQIAGLGQSPTSRTYAISSLAEAQAYLRHPVLGPRLNESAAAVAGLQGLTAGQVFGRIDAGKLHSSMTLFLRADAQASVFQQVLAKYFEGRPDPATERLLDAARGIDGAFNA